MVCATPLLGALVRARLTLAEADDGRTATVVALRCRVELASAGATHSAVERLCRVLGACLDLALHNGARMWDRLQTVLRRSL